MPSSPDVQDGVQTGAHAPAHPLPLPLPATGAHAPHVLLPPAPSTGLRGWFPPEHQEGPPLEEQHPFRLWVCSLLLHTCLWDVLLPRDWIVICQVTLTRVPSSLAGPGAYIRGAGGVGRKETSSSLR